MRTLPSGELGAVTRLDDLAVFRLHRHVDRPIARRSPRRAGPASTCTCRRRRRLRRRLCRACNAATPASPSSSPAGPRTACRVDARHGEDRLSKVGHARSACRRGRRRTAPSGRRTSPRPEQFRRSCSSKHALARRHAIPVALPQVRLRVVQRRLRGAPGRRGCSRPRCGVQRHRQVVAVLRRQLALRRLRKAFSRAAIRS